MIDFTSQFALQRGKHTFARYTGPCDEETIRNLYIFIRRVQWRGQLYINFSGNGGVTNIIFTDDTKLISKKAVDTGV